MVLLALAALLGALALYTAAECFMTTATAELAVARAANRSAADPNAVQAQSTRAKSVAEALKKKNLFTPIPPKENPVKEVMGILGSEALINGKWHKAGDSVGDAKILAIEPTKVRVFWNGQEKEFAPLASEGIGRNGPGRPKGRGNGPAGRGSGGSPEERANAKGRFRNMSPEERREEMRKRAGASRR